MDNTKLCVEYIRIIEMKYSYEVIGWINYLDLWNKKKLFPHIPLGEYCEKYLSKIIARCGRF